MQKQASAARAAASLTAVVHPTAVAQNLDTIGNAMGVIGSLNGNYIINVNLSIGDGSTIDEIVRRIINALNS